MKKNGRVDNDIKIKVWGIAKLNRKQFLSFYSIMSIVFMTLAILSFILNKEEGVYFKWGMSFFSSGMGFFWLLVFLMGVLEGQFYWTKFVKKQLGIIENQRNEIFEKNEELNQQKEEIQAQADNLLEANEAISLQKSIIEKKHDQITDSINYASRIQTAVLPSDKFINEILPEHFVLFKPRDIVSGDFYWLHQEDKNIMVAVADCTGHGVPGAFMSMLGISFLNEIVSKLKIAKANLVLNELRNLIKTTLSQTGDDNESKDGMDIALCVIDTETNSLQYAGAYNPLYIIRNKELIEIKASRNPIGIYLKEKPFENNELQLQKKDMLYMFSDGFVDQFGGEKSTKFKSKKFKDLLLSISDKQLIKQKQILNNAFEEWRGNIEQVDDVLVMGIRI